MGTASTGDRTGKGSFPALPSDVLNHPEGRAFPFSEGPGMRIQLRHEDGHLDLVPLIDCVFLLLLFFMLCGRISTDRDWEQVTVPPGRSANPPAAGLQREVVNLSGAGEQVRIRLGATLLPGQGEEAWRSLRRDLDLVCDRSDAGAPVLVELRADQDLPWRTVQTAQQVLADCADPGLLGERLRRRPITRLEFAVRSLDGG